MEKEEILLLIEKTLKERIISGKSKLGKLNEVDNAKTRGVTAGAEMGLNFIYELNHGITYEQAISSFNEKLKQAIYSLILAENEYERNKSTLGYNIKCEIIYNDNLVNTMQILRDKFRELELTD